MIERNKTMAKKTEKKKEPYFRHRVDAEWLTMDICNAYKEKAKDIRNRSTSDSEFHKLCRQLVDRCDVTEVQAINILNGLHMNEYVAMYERMRNSGGNASGNDDKKEYLEWLAEKEENDRKLDDYSLPDED